MESLIDQLRRFLVKICRHFLGLFVIHLTKATVAQNDVALSYHQVRRLYFLAVVFLNLKNNPYYVNIQIRVHAL